MVVRVPRRRVGVRLLEHELRWLPELAPGLPLPVPVPLRSGRPGLGYPWCWAVCPYLPGELAAAVVLPDTVAAGQQLGRFLTALHRPAPRDAPENAFRGVPLSRRAALAEESLDRIDDRGVRRRLAVRWSRALQTPPWPGPPVWLHGDLHPANLLVLHGRLSGVLDFGDLTAGDPATDLAAGWMLLDAAGREALRATARPAGAAVDAATWRRAEGWALALGLALVRHAGDDPLLGRVGRRTLAELVADG